jgi:hypothetical protein
MYVPDRDIRGSHSVDVENPLTAQMIELMRDRGRKAKGNSSEEIETKDLPFYYDPQTYIELGGKKPWKKEQL